MRIRVIPRTEASAQSVIDRIQTVLETRFEHHAIGLTDVPDYPEQRGSVPLSEAIHFTLDIQVASADGTDVPRGDILTHLREAVPLMGVDIFPEFNTPLSNAQIYEMLEKWCFANLRTYATPLSPYTNWQMARGKITGLMWQIEYQLQIRNSEGLPYVGSNNWGKQVASRIGYPMPTMYDVWQYVSELRDEAKKEPFIRDWEPVKLSDDAPSMMEWVEVIRVELQGLKFVPTLHYARKRLVDTGVAGLKTGWDIEGFTYPVLDVNSRIVAYRRLLYSQRTAIAKRNLAL